MALWLVEQSFVHASIMASRSLCVCALCTRYPTNTEFLNSLALMKTLLRILQYTTTRYDRVVQFSKYKCSKCILASLRFIISAWTSCHEDSENKLAKMMALWCTQYPIEKSPQPFNWNIQYKYIYTHTQFEHKIN